MKKFLIAFLAALACTLTIVAFGCETDNGNNGTTPKEYTVEFVPTENLEYVCDGLADGENTLTVKSGTTVSFSVTVPALYDIPAVYANGNTVKVQEGVYSVVVTSDVIITTAEVKMPSPSLTGSGTDDSPVLISTPSDYIYIANRINEGDTSFISLYYALANDIDFAGTEIPVIGNGTKAYSYFMGNFNGNGHTISNFKIKTNGISYVALFGYVISSGGMDGTGMIVNLNVDNFEIEAQASTLSSMYVGSLVGYGIASSVIACSATNGSIVVNSDNAVFSYVGGAVGIQNSATLPNGSRIDYYPASTSYVHTSVDISCSGGVYAAGGVVGYVISEHERAISSVINCYSDGNVFGGISSGGVVGNLSDYSSIANSYSLSDVYASSRYLDNETYSHAYAGGLVGYIGNNAIISDSFAKNGYVGGSSESGENYVHIGEIVGGKAEATAVADEGILFNCKSGEEVKTTADFFKNTLYWQACDWVITDGSYPVINLDEAQPNAFTVTFNYSGKTADSKPSRDLKISLSEDFYSPLFYFYSAEKNVDGEEFGDTVLADSGETSYGYFFDQELTQRVPYGYIPTRNITLYTGFINYSAVAGTYYLVASNSKREVTLTLHTNGSYVYYDGVEFNDFYTYNGTKIIFGNALFARLSASVTVSEDASGNSVARPDLNYGVVKFAAVKTENGLKIFDGSFFTEEKSLIANRYALYGEWYNGTDEYVFYSDYTGKLNKQSFTYTLTASGDLTISIGSTTKTGTYIDGKITVDGALLSKYDIFKGVWEIASNVNRRYEFDGKNSWTYKVKGVVNDSGTYTIGENGVATLKSGLTAEIDASGLLLIKKNGDNEYFVKDGSFSGIWIDLEHNILIHIDGFGSSLTGKALINEGGATSELIYILDGFFDGDGKTHITLLNGYSLFGYLTVNEDGSFTGTFFSSSTNEYFDGYNFYLLDTLEGDWVGEGVLGDITIDSLNFNGLGIFGNGSVSLNGGPEVEYSLDDNFDATFGDYKVEFDDENNVITITLGDQKVELYRKDEISAYVLISDDGTKYAFNGGGNLSKGGKLTVTDAGGNIIAVLGYKKVSGSIANLDLEIELYSSFRGTETVGTITINGYKFELDYTGSVSGLPKGKTMLNIDNPFTGSWCVSAFDTTIQIGKFDLSNSTEGSFLDMTSTAKFTYLPDYGCLVVGYITGEMIAPVELYLIMLTEGNMVISSYNVLTTGDNLIYCAPNDGLQGEWYDTVENSQKKFRFDGLADSLYTAGVAWNESGEIFFYTRRFGNYYFWSADGEKAYTIVKNGDAEGASMVYEKNRFNRIVFNDFDINSCILKIESGDTVYKFNLTNVEVNGVEKEYTITKVNGNITELTIYEDEQDTKGVKFIVNHAEKTIEQAD
ncbi:MAG: hypothetical protein J1G07_02050 [Clostridiales bacterium]|nr:hypothetical protein [Clostridiales bacterium]